MYVMSGVPPVFAFVVSVPAGAHRVRDDEPLVVEIERLGELHPQLRGIDDVVDVFAKHLVYLPAPRIRIADDLELRPVRVRRLAADEQAVQHDVHRAH